MPRQTDLSYSLLDGAGSLVRSPAAVALFAGLSLSACVNTRVFTETELADVGRGCGLAAGEVMQEPDEPRFLFLMAVEPTVGQYRCVRRWARRHNMHLAYISGIEFIE